MVRPARAAAESVPAKGYEQRVWTLAFGYHEDRTPTHAYEATREAASWRRERKALTGARRVDSERIEPFVDISGLFAARCPQ